MINFFFTFIVMAFRRTSTSIGPRPQLKEKIVQIYESFFKVRIILSFNQNYNKSTWTIISFILYILYNLRRNIDNVQFLSALDISPSNSITMHSSWHVLCTCTLTSSILTRVLNNIFWQWYLCYLFNIKLCLPII